MAKDCQGVTVHPLSPVHRRGPVFYASLPCGPCAAETLKGRGTNGTGQAPPYLYPVGSPCGGGKSPQAPQPIFQRSGFAHPGGTRTARQAPSPGGRMPGTGISFSEGGGKVWAALGGDESAIGIDVAGSDEFRGEYPFHRVFHAQELEHALSLAGGDLEKASALLWSIKEAVVKALGCAFHLVDPRQITVYPSTGGAGGEDGGYTFPVGLSGKALVRFPLGASRSLWVRSLPQGKMWLSIALLNRRPIGS